MPLLFCCEIIVNPNVGGYVFITSECHLGYSFDHLVASSTLSKGLYSLKLFNYHSRLASDITSQLFNWLTIN